MILHLRNNLVVETHQKLKLAKQNAVLKRSGQIKQHMIIELLNEKKVGNVKDEFDRVYKHSLSIFKKNKVQFDSALSTLKNLNSAEKIASKPEERSASISPDEMPDKQLSIFDRSHISDSQTHIDRTHNSLYYLEH